MSSRNGLKSRRDHKDDPEEAIILFRKENYHRQPQDRYIDLVTSQIEKLKATFGNDSLGQTSNSVLAVNSGTSFSHNSSNHGRCNSNRGLERKANRQRNPSHEKHNDDAQILQMRKAKRTAKYGVRNARSSKEFVLIDTSKYKLSEEELAKRKEERKSRNQILGQLDVYNSSRPSNERIPQCVTSSMLRDYHVSNHRTCSYDEIMRRADKALEESKAILNKQLNYTSSTVSRTEDSPLKSCLSGQLKELEKFFKRKKSKSEFVTIPIDSDTCILHSVDLHLTNKDSQGFIPDELVESSSGTSKIKHLGPFRSESALQIAQSPIHPQEEEEEESEDSEILKFINNNYSILQNDHMSGKISDPEFDTSAHRIKAILKLANEKYQREMDDVRDRPLLSRLSRTRNKFIQLLDPNVVAEVNQDDFVRRQLEVLYPLTERNFDNTNEPKEPVQPTESEEFASKLTELIEKQEGPLKKRHYGRHSRTNPHYLKQPICGRFPDRSQMDIEQSLPPNNRSFWFTMSDFDRLEEQALEKERLTSQPQPYNDPEEVKMKMTLSENSIGRIFPENMLKIQEL